MTSSFSVVDLKGNILGLTIYPPSLIIIAFIPAKLWKGGGGEAEDRQTARSRWVNVDKNTKTVSNGHGMIARK